MKPRLPLSEGLLKKHLKVPTNLKQGENAEQEVGDEAWASPGQRRQNIKMDSLSSNGSWQTGHTSTLQVPYWVTMAQPNKVLYVST
jgi:hypothetical protein